MASNKIMNYLLPILLLTFTQITLAQAIRVDPEPDHFAYNVGDTIRMTITAVADPATLKNAVYVWQPDGLSQDPATPLDLTHGPVTVQTKGTRPGTMLLKVAAATLDDKPIRIWCGATIAADQIQPSATRPDDFDAFWKDQLTELAKVPPNPRLEPILNPRVPAGINYFAVKLDNVDNTHLYGQLAVPSKPGKYPAMLILQGAGVYPLPPANVLDRAQEGWLAFNIMAHDLPFNLPFEECQRLEHTSLKDYSMLGNTSRQTSYFRLMILRCCQAANYLTSRPDWDGQVFLVTGASQGGLQTIATAALHPRVTAVIAGKIAGCDTLATTANREISWPEWGRRAAAASPADAKRILEASRYFDPINFAPRITAPTLIYTGLADTTALPTGVLTLYNQLTCPKRLALDPRAPHAFSPATKVYFDKIINSWTDSLRNHQPVPFNATLPTPQGAAPN